jgi:hypothetical protein
MSTQLDLLSGVRLRDVGVQKVYENNKGWVDEARAVAKSLAVERGLISIDDVLEAIPRPVDVHPNATGSIFREKCWLNVGYTKSRSPSAHARAIGVFQLKENA